MLRGLTIREIVLIEHAEIAFRPGLNVLTGETGAGKSILLDALGFALGARGRGALLRAGADQGEVVAEFELAPDHLAGEILAEAGLAAPQGELILRRVADASGRTRAFVNDSRCGADLLARLADTLVEVHGQQDDRGLLDPKHHRALLDAYAGGDALAAVRLAWRDWAAARAALASLRAIQAEAERDREFLAHAVAEVDALDPQPGEEAVLDATRRRMQAAERIRADVVRAGEALGGAGAEVLMSDAARWLAGAAETAEGGLDAPLAALDRALDALAEAQQGVEAALHALDVDPLALERCEERLFALRALARKHRVTPDALSELAADLRARHAAIEAGEDRAAELAAAVDAAKSVYDAAAGALSAERAAAAARLDAAMAEELAPLKLDRARFATTVVPAEPGPEGADSVTFTVATNPGSPPGPLNQIASGGELSRFLLALKVCLAARGADLSMIFDEIDRGVGGATADAVGRRLATLGQGGQVLVVTHAPQVAARADHHWRIEKRVEDGVARTAIQPLDQAARTDEIARMLSGDRLTEAARAAARSLIAG
ncbi:MAG: DNA repair protein RecN [Pseudomonadota bacterium]